MSVLDILKVKDEQGVWHTIPALKGDKGDQGNSIESFVFSDDGTITVTFTDETTETFTGLKAALESVGNLISEVEEAELVRIANENTRKNNETSRVSAESSRVTTEAGRASAETSRQSNETSRQNAEASRASAETARASAESARATAESGRATAESGRVSAEAGRVSAEAGRVSAEAERAAEFATWEATIAAKADQADLDAEVTRATAAETQQSQQIDGKISKSSQAAKTTGMTQPVGIDENGKLWTTPGGGSTAEDVTYNPSTTYTSGTVGAALKGKVERNFGVAHAGEFLVVGDDGMVTSEELSVWAGGSY